MKLTIKQIKELKPCPRDWPRVKRLLKKINRRTGRGFSAKDARRAGCTFDDIVWVASAASRSDKAVERKLRHWMADCAARVLHIYEKQVPQDMRVRQAIEAAHDYADGNIDAAAWDAARAAAGDAAGAANEIQGASILEKAGKPLFFLSIFGFKTVEALLEWAQ